MTDAFDPASADFSSMTEEGAHIGMILQRVRVAVDEEGTRAASATSVEMTNSAPMPVGVYIELTFDSPFIYAVTDSVTGAVLFLGLMTNPAACPPVG